MGRSPISCISTSAASAGTCSTWRTRRSSPGWPGCCMNRFSGAAPQKRPDPSAYPERLDGIGKTHMPRVELRGKGSARWESLRVLARGARFSRIGSDRARPRQEIFAYVILIEANQRVESFDLLDRARRDRG